MGTFAPSGSELAYLLLLEKRCTGIPSLARQRKGVPVGKNRRAAWAAAAQDDSRGSLPKERQERILQLLRAIQRVWSVDELIDFFKVSPMTIRRDLFQLESDGVIIRTHGGCIATMYSRFLASYHERIATNFELKSRIGRAAAGLIRSGQTILLFDGSTTFHVLANLGRFERLCVYTNSIAMISELARFPRIEVFVLGGTYNRNMSFLEGGLTERNIQQMIFDLVYFGVDGLSSDGECLVTNHETANMIQRALERGKKKVLLADHTKVGLGGRVRCAALSDLDYWITTDGLTPAQKSLFGRKTSLIISPK